MLAFKEHVYIDMLPKKGEVIMAVDVGGTNCNFGIFNHIDNQHILLFSIHFNSQEIISFVDVLKQVLIYLKTTYGILVQQLCIASSGVVSPHRNYSKPTNLPFAIDVQDIQKATDIKSIALANDFEVIGLGIGKIDPQNVVQVHKGVMQERAHKAIVGAGSGLGKCMMFWESDRNRYMPIASEGGNADFAAQSDIEFELITFIRNMHNNFCNISWTDVLSGKGIRNIYDFFCQYNQKKDVSNVLKNGMISSEEIFNARMSNQNAWNTYELYARIYARCVKNFALDSLAIGGMYVTGGIAVRNLSLFQTDLFLNEFINCRQQKALLREIPIYVITDYNISLYGAIEYLQLGQ